MSRRYSAQEEIALDRLPKASLNRESLRETLTFARHVRPYRKRFIAGLVTLFFSASCGLAFPLLAGTMIDAALRPGGAHLPFWGALTLGQVASLLVGAVALQALASFNSALAFNRVGQSALADLRRECYERLVSLPMTRAFMKPLGSPTPTSSLDSESERLVQGALDRLMEGRTSFIIAHRLATVRNADKIAVIKHGRVVELGTHDELSARPDGLYRHLSSLQFGQEGKSGLN